MSIAQSIHGVTRKFADQIETLTFDPPITHVYSPLKYAWTTHKNFLLKYGNSQKEIVFLGMNPGPWGMAQNGIPFGEIGIVKDWLNISGKIEQPGKIHPKRPIDGFSCHRSEVSGRRLWGMFKERFQSPENFFSRHFIMNYCPLLFYEDTGKNITPDKLPVSNRKSLFHICDKYLRDMTDIMKTRWVIGVGRFAEDRAIKALQNTGIQIARILHPSPANPSANRDFAGQATQTLKNIKIW